MTEAGKNWISDKARRGEKVCSDCGTIYMGDLRKTARCKSCSNRRKLSVIDHSGSRNGMWRGGHKYWQQGKYGRDKDGLSWKTQRRKCWERDNFTCVDCGWVGADEPKRRPHADHEIPYRISFSHALENLHSRCASCHKKAEAARKELWGGKTFGGHVGRNPTPTCSFCGRKRRLLEGVCIPCDKEHVLIPRVLSMREEGMSQDDIARVMGVTQPTISHWLARTRS